MHAEYPAPTCPRHRNREGWPWCPPCRDRIHDAIIELPTLHRRLLDDDRMGTPRRAERRAINGDPPSPSPLFDAADELAGVLAGWADAWADHLGEEWTSRDPRACARYLLRYRRRADLLSSPLAVDVGAELLALHGSALHRLHGDPQKPVHHSLAGPCPTCGGTALHQIGGTDDIECGACGLTGTRVEYDALMEVHRREFMAA
jgi:hypothetical protein